MIRSTITHAMAVYIGAGIFAASLMGAAIPALNGLGLAWIALTWPRVVRCATVESRCDPMPPEWMNPYIFSFDEAAK